MPCPGSVKPEPPPWAGDEPLDHPPALLCPRRARSHPFTMVLFSGVMSASLTSAVAESFICFSPMSNVTFPSFCPYLFPSGFFFSPAFPASQDNCLVSAGAGGTGSISLPAETHEGAEEGGRERWWLGVTGQKHSLSLQTRYFLVPVQSFPTEGAAGQGVWWR